MRKDEATYTINPPPNDSCILTYQLSVAPCHISGVTVCVHVFSIITLTAARCAAPKISKYEVDRLRNIAVDHMDVCLHTPPCARTHILSGHAGSLRERLTQTLNSAEK